MSINIGARSLQSCTVPKAKIMIVGAGIGGLFLAGLLERIGVSYHVYERASELRALGSIMTLGPNILPAFEQLGLLEELQSISVPHYKAYMYEKVNMTKLGTIEMLTKKSTGYDDVLFERPKLYKLLRKQVPVEKISLGKKVISVEEKGEKVFIHCSDNTSYEGDMLVGADGAYSAVRQSLYKQLDDQGRLPRVDLEDYSIGWVSMVGIAQLPNLDRYPILKDGASHFSNVLGENFKIWTTVRVPKDRVCWAVAKQLTPEEAKNEKFNNGSGGITGGEWATDAVEAMIQEFKDQPCPWGGKMNDLFELTDKNLISKVFLEEKMFKTWFDGRIGLLGDSCHKMVPGAGQGAVNAMQDAVVLANCIYHLEDTSSKSITAAFEDYFHQRYNHAYGRFQDSSNAMKSIYGQTWTDKIRRFLTFNIVPKIVVSWQLSTVYEYRPQIEWLPQIPNRGTTKVLPQVSSNRRKIENEELASAV